MFAYIKGRIAEVSGDNLVLEAGPIGYNIKISSAIAAALPPSGEEIKIYTYTLVREDAFLLYGFLTKDDLDIFKKVITVSGIGPKGGLAILSAMTADDLRLAIISGDARAIAKAPGIGAKTAERLILDLKDKVSLEETSFCQNTKPQSDAPMEDAKREAIEALTALGYSASDALKAVKQVELAQDMDVEAILKAALGKIMLF